MKLITKLQSVSDIITNSSSEVFLVSEYPPYELHGDGYITIDPIDRTWLELNWDCEQDLICNIPGLENYSSVDYMKWEELYNELIDKATELASGYYYVDIEDHYDYDLYKEDVYTISQIALYHDYRH